MRLGYEVEPYVPEGDEIAAEPVAIIPGSEDSAIEPEIESVDYSASLSISEDPTDGLVQVPYESGVSGLRQSSFIEWTIVIVFLAAVGALIAWLVLRKKSITPTEEQSELKAAENADDDKVSENGAPAAEEV